MIIYKTICNINKKIYVGKDSKNNPEYYGSGTLIKRAIKKYGKENFKKIILEKCANIEQLNEREIYWIKELKATDNKIGYNITAGGEGIGNVYALPKEQQKKWKINHKKACIRRRKRMQNGIYTKNELKDIQRKKLKQYTKKELLQHTNRSKRFLEGNYTEKEKLFYKKEKERKSKGLFTKAEKNAYKNESKRKKLGNFTKKELEAHKNLSLKYSLNGINSPSWMGYVYVYDKNYNLLFKFNNIKETEKILKISQSSLLKLFKTRYFSLEKLYTLKCDYSILKDCFFIRSKKELSDSTDLQGGMACSGNSCEII